MSWLDLSILYIAVTLMGEAGVDTDQAMRAVGETIAVRAEEGRLMPIEVVVRPRQYSCWNKGSKKLLAQVPHWRRDSPDKWALAQGLAEEIASRRFQISASRRNQFYNPDLCRPVWRSAMRDKVKIGKMIFGRIENNKQRKSK